MLNSFFFILQGYDSIPAEIPDPKAKKVDLFTSYFLIIDRRLNLAWTYERSFPSFLLFNSLFE